MNRTTTNSFACPFAIYNPFRNYPIKYLNFIRGAITHISHSLQINRNVGLHPEQNRHGAPEGRHDEFTQ
ncbi:MAG: hypothetical protein OXD49_08605, partial [Candidatus Poribacteria bacterium]|nr:hypothetical protein [Candidatus Poribacteria bacterium]